MVAIKRAVIVGLGLIFVYLAVATAFWNEGRSIEAMGLPRAIPDDPDIVMEQASSEFERSLGELNAKEYATVLKAARFAPAKAEPLLFAALHARSEADKDRLLKTARTRNPRLRSTRIVLLDRYLSSGDGTAAAREIGALGRLMGIARPALTELLAQVASHPDTRSDTVAALSENPLLPALLMKLANQGASPFQILDLAQHMRGAAKDPAKGRWITGVIARFAERGDLDGAKRLWAHFYAIESDNRSSLVFDPDFKGTGGPPFGWSVYHGSEGFAELHNEALQIEYYGRKETNLAGQLLTLPPGHYLFRYTLQGAEDSRPAELVWRIACLKGQQALLDLSFAPKSLFGAVPTNRFIVPETGCEGQLLTLSGIPMEFSNEQSAVVTRVSVERVDAQ